MGGIGSNQSAPETTDLYGGMSARNAGRYAHQFGNPLAWGFGLGTGRRAQGFRDDVASGQFGDSPLAGIINYGKTAIPDFLGNSQTLGQDIATKSPQLFAQYQNELNRYMQGLPSLQASGRDAAMGARDVTARAGTMVNEAFDPIASQSLYQETLRRALDSGRQGAAGRGLLDSGGQQGLEDTTARDLGYQFAQSRLGNQQSALQTLSGAQQAQQGLAGGAAQLAALSPQAQQELAQVYQQMVGLQQQGISMPFDALQQAFGFLAGTQNPMLAVAQATAPQVGQSSKGWSV